MSKSKGVDEAQLLLDLAEARERSDAIRTALLAYHAEQKKVSELKHQLEQAKRRAAQAKTQYEERLLHERRRASKEIYAESPNGKAVDR